MRDSLTVEIVRVHQENPEVTTLYFARPFDFMAGQYITVFIEGSQVREGKAYSISSRPSEELMSITVKDVGGEFSSYLCSRRVGDTLHISRAYGDFNPQTERPLVGIAAGCGLSPIWSILADAQQPTFLYLSQNIWFSRRSWRLHPSRSTSLVPASRLKKKMVGGTDVLRWRRLWVKCRVRRTFWSVAVCHLYAIFGKNSPPPVSMNQIFQRRHFLNDD